MSYNMEAAIYSIHVTYKYENPQAYPQASKPPFNHYIFNVSALRTPQFTSQMQTTHLQTKLHFGNGAYGYTSL